MIFFTPKGLSDEDATRIYQATRHSARYPRWMFGIITLIIWPVMMADFFFDTKLLNRISGYAHAVITALIMFLLLWLFNKKRCPNCGNIPFVRFARYLSQISENAHCCNRCGVLLGGDKAPFEPDKRS
jgi:hypothetical protein